MMLESGSPLCLIYDKVITANCLSLLILATFTNVTDKPSRYYELFLSVRPHRKKKGKEKKLVRWKKTDSECLKRLAQVVVIINRETSCQKLMQTLFFLLCCTRKPTTNVRRSILFFLSVYTCLHSAASSTNAFYSIPFSLPIHMTDKELFAFQSAFIKIQNSSPLAQILGSDATAELLTTKTLQKVSNANDPDCVGACARNHMSPNLR